MKNYRLDTLENIVCVFAIVIINNIINFMYHSYIMKHLLNVCIFSCFVADFDEYRTTLMDHLTTVKVAHWDK